MNWRIDGEAEDEESENQQGLDAAFRTFVVHPGRVEVGLGVLIKRLDIVRLVHGSEGHFLLLDTGW